MLQSAPQMISGEVAPCLLPTLRTPTKFSEVCKPSSLLPTPMKRARAIRTLFMETLDFDHADVLVPLGAAKDPNLPSDARLLARRDGFSVLYISLDNADDSRVKTATSAGAAKIVGDAIADEPLLLFTNRDCDQLHVIYPDLSGNRPRLQRMVAYRGQPGRTVVQQIANLWHDYGESGMTMGKRSATPSASSPSPMRSSGTTKPPTTTP